MVVPAGSSWMISFQFTVSMAPLGFSLWTSSVVVWLWDIPYLYLIGKSSVCQSALNTIHPLCLLGVIHVPLVNRRANIVFLWLKTRTFGSW